MLLVGLLVPLVAFGNEAEAQTAEREVPTFVVPVNSSNRHVFEAGENILGFHRMQVHMPILPSFNNGICVREFFLAFDGVNVFVESVIVFGDNFSSTITLGELSYESGVHLSGREISFSSNFTTQWDWDATLCGDYACTYESFRAGESCNDCYIAYSDPDCFASNFLTKLEEAEDAIHFTIEIFENDVLVARIITEEVALSNYGVFGSIDFTTDSEYGATARICNAWGTMPTLENLRFDNRNLTDADFTYERESGSGWLATSWVFNLSEAFVATLAPGTHIFEAEYSYEYWFIDEEHEWDVHLETTTIELSLYIPTPDDDNQNQGGDNQNQGSGNQNQNNPYKTPPTGQSAVATVGIVTMFVAMGIIGIWTYKKKAVV